MLIKTIRKLMDLERIHQEVKHKHRTPYTPGRQPEANLRVLMEEVGEVARVLNEREQGKLDATDVHLAQELIQVMAVASAWLEVLPDPTGEESADISSSSTVSCEYELTVSLGPYYDEKEYIAIVPAMPQCVGKGATKEEAKKNWELNFKDMFFTRTTTSIG